MQYKVLLVEDLAEDQHVIARAIGKIAAVDVAKSLSEAHALIEVQDFDLILMDVMLPDGDGFKFCAKLRNDDRMAHVPVIFITGLSETPDKVMGFSLGADDYITKPFDPFELRARIEARLKKVVEGRLKEAVMTRRDLRVNLQEQRAFHVTSGSDAPIDLTPLEFKLLVHLLKHPEHVFTREQLLDSVWGDRVNVLDRTVDMHVSALRRKILPTAFTIKSVHGVGYRFTPRDEM